MLKGKFMGVREEVNTFVLERKFEVKKLGAAVLRVTALGLYTAHINGKRVGENYLTPGWTNYHKIVQVQEYDVSSLLQEGENVLTLTVGEGWYKGPLFWLMKREMYGSETAAAADLVLEKETISTDERFAARTASIREAGIYAGETADFTAEPRPLTVKQVPFDKTKLVLQEDAFVRTTERLPVKEVITTPKGDVVYDFGQNISGVVEIVTPEDFAGTLTMEFGELMVGGELYRGNLGAAKATDTLTARGRTVYAPEFTFHGFRYMRLSGGELPKENVTALVRHTDMRRTGNIETSDVRVDKLISNAVWSQRDNFVDIPSDCPQRSERLGWTGDINAFCTAAAYNFDIRAFMKKWLRDLRSEQAEGGEVPVVVPYVLAALGPEMTMNTSAMWSDCIITIPYALYEMYGDKSFLSENYEAMERFLSAREKNMEDGLITKGFEYGDWLAMEVDPLLRHVEFASTDKYLIANFLHIRALAVMRETAEALGRKEDARRYQEAHEEALAAVRREYITAGGKVASETIAAHVLALVFGIVPEAFRKKTAAALNARVLRHGCRVVTGFIGTPYLLFALADNGYMETAGKVLMNIGFPGWLYEVDMGATTIWERWNSLLPDGTPNPDGMNSCNHYAYGSVMEFIYRRIAGIEAQEPGFSRVRICPHPVKGLSRVRACFESVHGVIRAGYEEKGGSITFFAELPAGVRGELYLPDGTLAASGEERLSYACPWEELAGPVFALESPVVDVLTNPKASRAFSEAFAGVFHPLELNYLKNSSDTLAFAKQYLLDKGKLTGEDFERRLARLNELYLA